MGYPRAVKLRAMVLYASGENYEQIARTLSRELGRPIDPKTPMRWKAAAVPADWDTHRREMEETAARDALSRITKERGRITSRHFDDLEALRGLVKHSLFEQRDQGGRRVAVPKASLRMRDVRDGVAAYKDVALTQRLVLGLATDHVESAPVVGGGAVILLPAKDEGEGANG